MVSSHLMMKLKARNDHRRSSLLVQILLLILATSVLASSPYFNSVSSESAISINDLQKQMNKQSSVLRRRLEAKRAHRFRPEDEDEDEDISAEDPLAEIRAGAHKAKQQFKSIDRFSRERAKQLKELKEHYRGHGDGEAKDKHHHGSTHHHHHPHHHHDTMTKKMKIQTPGTAEFVARQKLLMEYIDRKHHKKRLFGGSKEAVEHATTKLRKDSLPFRKEISTPGLVKRTLEKIPVLKHFSQLSREEEMILDASVSFYMQMETRIYKGEDGKLTEDEMIALSDYLDLLSLTLPPEWHLHLLINELRSRFEYIAEGYEHMMKVLQKHPLPRKQWSRDCTSARGRYNVGFDCGNWKLLHIATLGVAEQKGGINLVESGMVSHDTKTFSPLEAADIIRNFMKYYSEYADDFVKNYDDCDMHRRCDRLTDEKEGATIGDWKELALWLWEVHNEVAIRALKEKKTRKMKKEAIVTEIEEMKVTWPTIAECFMCFEEDGTWDENEIFYFLEQNYWLGSDVNPKYDRLLRFQEKESAWASVLSYILACGILYVFIRLILLNSQIINLTVKRAKRLANIKEIKRRTV